MPGDFEEGSLALHQEVRCVGTVFKLQNNIIYQYRPLYTIIYTLHIQIYTIIYMTNKCHTTTYQFIPLYTCSHPVTRTLRDCSLCSVATIPGPSHADSWGSRGHCRHHRAGPPSLESECDVRVWSSTESSFAHSIAEVFRSSSTEWRIRILVDGPAKSRNS